MSYQSNISRVTKIFKKNQRRALETVGIFVTGEAQLRAPVDTGNLRDSITYRADEDFVAVGTNVEYAPYVEFGTGRYAQGGNGRRTPWRYRTEDGWFTTSGQRPQPFLTPAFEDNRNKIQRIITQELGRGLK